LNGLFAIEQPSLGMLRDGEEYDAGKTTVGSIVCQLYLENTTRLLPL
jgi:hypothetical protein